MKILLEGLDGTLVNFDNVLDICSVELTDSFHVRARSASFDQGCYEAITLFKGTKEEADEWMDKFKDAIINTRKNVSIISIKIPNKVKPVPNFDFKRFLKEIALGVACDIEIYNVLSDESWEQIRTDAVNQGLSLPETLKEEVKKRVLPVHIQWLLKYPSSEFYSCYSTSIWRMSTVKGIYERHGKFRLTEDAHSKMENHIGFDKIHMYNLAVKEYI